MLNHLARMIAIGCVLEMLWLASYGLSPLRSHSGLFVALMLAAFGLCLLTYGCCPIKDRRGVLCVLGFALLFRLTVLPAQPGQSEDVYRYLWDGRLSSLGVDPYRYPPDAPELAHLRDTQIYPLINSKPYITAYPPLSQALFRLSYGFFGAAVLPMKAIFSILEFGALILAWRLIVIWRTGLQPLLLMAWNPFFIFEFSHSGHSDSGMIFLILLSIYLAERSRYAGSIISYAGAVLAKLHPALWFPLFVRRMGWKVSGAGLSVIVAGFWVYLSLRLYFRLFEFNAGIHYFLRYVGHVAFGQAWDKVTGPYLAVLLALIAAWILWRFPLRNSRDLLHAGFWIMTADLCLATTVHPWYISWAALALPFFPYAFMAYWTGVCCLSYLAYAYHPVYEPAWVLLVEYLPLYVLMAWEIRRGAPLLQSKRGRCRQGA
jgi:alpha-1,6-mannosyltransferase